jgi:hypothetical protein
MPIFKRIKSRETKFCEVARGEIESVTKFLSGNSKGRCHLERCGSRWENDIKIVDREMMLLALSKRADKKVDLVDREINLRVL